MNGDPKAAREVFYDGACPVCRREIALYRNMAGLEGAEWTDVSQTNASLGPLTQAEALARFHVRLGDGRYVSGFAAFLAVWRRSKRLRWIAQALDRQPFLLVGEGTYRLFLLLRRFWRRPGNA